MTRVYAYLRVSGRSQLDGDGFPRQIAAIKDYAAKNHLEIAHIYEERAVSGTTEWEDRPAWTDMISALNGIQTIVIERLDRLARELYVQEHILRDLKKRGITLISTAEPDLGSSDPTRILFRQILGSIAEYEKAQLVLKLRAARKRARQIDGRPEGQIPYGNLPGEAIVVQRIKEGMNLGMTAAKISRWLNNKQVPTRHKKRWHPFVVGEIMRTIRGELTLKQRREQEKKACQIA